MARREGVEAAAREEGDEMLKAASKGAVVSNSSNASTSYSNAIGAVDSSSNTINYSKFIMVATPEGVGSEGQPFGCAPLHPAVWPSCMVRC